MFILKSINKYFKKFVRPEKFNVAGAKKIPLNMNNSQLKNRIVWIDMEMTGLNVDTDRILEVACVITDENLVTVSDEFQVVLHQSENQLNSMDDWCTKHHKESGLIEESLKSTINEQIADERLLNFLKLYIPQGKCPMAGNSVYMDRLFLRQYMPLSDNFMHYRIIDVSSIKEVVKRWKPEIFKLVPQKLAAHRALADINESITELNFYRKNVFIHGTSNLGST